MRNERLPIEALQRIQSTKLKRLVSHAYAHIPFYRELYNKHGLSPKDIRTVDDLCKIPIIDKNDFRTHHPSKLIDRRLKRNEYLKQISTSGSSGQILNFFIDPQYNQLRKAQFLRPYISNRPRLRERTLWFRGRPEKTQRLHQRLGFMADDQFYSGLDPDIQIKIIQEIKPKVMRGYGSTFQLIASKIKEQGITIHSPEFIFTDSEILSHSSRKKIESVFRTQVIDVYGTYETDNIAYECGHQTGYHIAMDCVIMEFLKDGLPAKPGEEGEIVCTVLDNLTFPFIRYNLHDLGTPINSTCPCGRTFPLMRSISGRTFLSVVKKDGSKISTTSFIAHFWSLGNYIHEFQIIQKAIDLFLIHIVPTGLYSEKIEKKIHEFMLEDFPYATVQIRLTDRIPREKSGKLMDFKTCLKE